MYQKLNAQNPTQNSKQAKLSKRRKQKKQSHHNARLPAELSGSGFKKPHVP